jgi:Dolichyl-phosphate-mannose-protein mannosyltransferase
MSNTQPIPWPPQRPLGAPWPPPRRRSLTVGQVAAIAFTLALAAGAVLRFWNLASKPDWQYDEGVYTQVSTNVLHGTLAEHVTYGTPWQPFLYQPPLYFLALSRWFGLTGASIYHARILGVLCSLGTLVVLFRLMWRLHGPAVALFTSLPVVFDGWLLYIQRASYIENLLLLLVTASVLAYQRALETGVWWRYALAGSAVAVTIAVKYTAAYLVLVVLLCWLIRNAGGAASNPRGAHDAVAEASNPREIRSAVTGPDSADGGASYRRGDVNGPGGGGSYRRERSRNCAGAEASNPRGGDAAGHQATVEASYPRVLPLRSDGAAGEASHPRGDGDPSSPSGGGLYRRGDARSSRHADGEASYRQGTRPVLGEHAGHLVLLATAAVVLGVYLLAMYQLFDLPGHDWWVQQNMVQLRRVLGLQRSGGTLTSPVAAVHLLFAQYRVFAPSFLIAVVAFGLAARRLAGCWRARSWAGLRPNALLWAWMAAGIVVFGSSSLRFPQYFALILVPMYCYWWSELWQWEWHGHVKFALVVAAVLAGVLSFTARVVTQTGNPFEQAQVYAARSIPPRAVVVTEEAIGDLIRQRWCRVEQPAPCEGVASYAITWKTYLQSSFTLGGPAFAKLMQGAVPVRSWTGFSGTATIWRLR